MVLIDFHELETQNPLYVPARRGSPVRDFEYPVQRVNLATAKQPRPSHRYLKTYAEHSLTVHQKDGAQVIYSMHCQVL
jgi:hypothetical protein